MSRYAGYRLNIPRFRYLKIVVRLSLDKGVFPLLFHCRMNVNHFFRQSYAICNMHVMALWHVRWTKMPSYQLIPVNTEHYHSLVDSSCLSFMILWSLDKVKNIHKTYHNVESRNFTQVTDIASLPTKRFLLLNQVTETKFFPHSTVVVLRAKLRILKFTAVITFLFR